MAAVRHLTSFPGAHHSMSTPQLPEDPQVIRILRALARPLHTRPDADVRRKHIAAASATRSRTDRRTSVFGRALRPVLAGSIALTLGAGLVTTAAPTAGDTVAVELAMAPGFTPSPVPFERAEDHVILTVDAERAARITETLARLMDEDPAVLSVRTDRTTFAVPASVAQQIADGEGDIETIVDTPMTSLTTPTTQSPVPSWGLDRIDADEERLDDSYRYISTGAGVRIYVIDTGVRSDHADLAGRVESGWSAIDDGNEAEDCNGHGTHVAGIAAGTVYGVAKGATIVPVRALDCDGSGYASSVIAGISWAIANHPGGPGVINLSLGGPANSAVDQAVADATDRGLLVVTAAGNNSGDACALSPARAATAATVGATTSADMRANYSNYGSCVDLFAPGSSITSAWHAGASSAATLSGTSMAAPHVAGIAARLLQTEPGSTPGAVTSMLTGSAESGVVGDDAGSANLLANLVDYDDIDCEAAYEEYLTDGAEIPEDCLTEVCERLDLEGFELPEGCPADEGEQDPDEGGRDGEGRPDTPPGLGGMLPPGFGGPVPGIERAPGLDGRLPPGLAEREKEAPPGLAEREEGGPQGTEEGALRGRAGEAPADPDGREGPPATGQQTERAGQQQSERPQAARPDPQDGVRKNRPDTPGTERQNNTPPPQRDTRSTGSGRP